MNPLHFFKGFYLPDGVVVYGNFTSDKEMSISGIINGNVKVKSCVVVETEGIINGDLSGENIVIKGRVNGNIYCKGKISTIKDAIVTGNIFAAEAKIDKLSIIKGVISHINQKKETESNPKLTVEGNAANSAELKPLANDIPLAPSETEKGTPATEEPPQNWF